MAKPLERSRTKRMETGPMRGALIALSLGAGLGLLSACSNTAEAESKTAWCALFREGDNSAELPEPVPCQFSQKQGM